MKKALFTLILVFFVSTAIIHAEQFYVIKPGDTLYAISREYGVSWQTIAKVNKIENPALIQIGALLHIPHDGDVVDENGDIVAVLATSQGAYAVHRDEQHLLARLIYAEARGESLDGQVAVGAVVLNRVKSSIFPDTIIDVIHQPKQFTPVELDLLPKYVDSRSLEAARRALAGEDPSGGAIFFYNPAKTSSPEFWKTRTVIKRIGNHNFAL